ncbi:MAG: RNA methyltransferase, partial [Proteobacteria bacterium]|nr:RNA methyltransferase [Pseudomonadota bacterium]
AVMIVLYECFKKSLTKPFKVAGYPKDRYINNEEREVLFNQLRETLIEIDFLNKDNPEYFMLPLKRFFNRINPRLNEYNLLMGLCRQMRRIVDVAKGRKA